MRFVSYFRITFLRPPDLPTSLGVSDGDLFLTATERQKTEEDRSGGGGKQNCACKPLKTVRGGCAHENMETQLPLAGARAGLPITRHGEMLEGGAVGAVNNHDEAPADDSVEAARPRRWAEVRVEVCYVHRQSVKSV